MRDLARYYLHRDEKTSKLVKKYLNFFYILLQDQRDFLKDLLDPECTLDWKVKYNVRHLCHRKMFFVKQCISDVIQENDIQLKPFVQYLSELILDEKENLRIGQDTVSQKSKSPKIVQCPGLRQHRPGHSLGKKIK